MSDGKRIPLFLSLQLEIFSEEQLGGFSGIFLKAGGEVVIGIKADCQGNVFKLLVLFNG